MILRRYSKIFDELQKRSLHRGVLIYQLYPWRLKLLNRHLWAYHDARFVIDGDKTGQDPAVARHQFFTLPDARQGLYGASAH